MKTNLKADIILEGASFYCGRGLDNDVDFVAVKGSRILALGKKRKCRSISAMTQGSYHILRTTS